MGTVYRARVEGEGGFVREFALKKLHDHLAGDREMVQMLLDEARLAARIRHPHVVSTIDVGRDGDSFFVVMDLVDGVNAAAFVKVGAPTSRRLAVRVILDALDGLSAAHNTLDDSGRPLEIVHRDISPENILVGRDGVAKLSDFGIAKARDRLRMTVGREIKGKFGYMPPEQLEGGPIDARADLFATGVVLWELLTGLPMLHGNRKRVKELEASVPSWFPTGAGDAIDRLIRRALSTSPDARYPDARTMAAALEEAAGGDVASREELGAKVASLISEAEAVAGDSTTRLDKRALAPTVPRTGNGARPPLTGADQTANVPADPAWARAGARPMIEPAVSTSPLSVEPPAPREAPRRSPLATAMILGFAGAVVATLILVTMNRSVASGHPLGPSDESKNRALASSPGLLMADAPPAMPELGEVPGAERVDAGAEARPPAGSNLRAPSKSRPHHAKSAPADEPTDKFGGRH